MGHFRTFEQFINESQVNEGFKSKHWKQLQNDRSIFSREDVDSANKHGGNPIPKSPYTIDDKGMVSKKESNESKVNESNNTEGDKKVSAFIKRLAKDWDIPVKDAISFVTSSMKRIKVNESNVNEGHDGEIGQIDDVTSKDEAMKSIEDMIKHSKENDGQYKKFRGAKWVGNTTEDKMDKMSMQYEDQYIVVGIVDGEYWMARSCRS